MDIRMTKVRNCWVNTETSFFGTRFFLFCVFWIGHLLLAANDVMLLVCGLTPCDVTLCVTKFRFKFIAILFRIMIL